MHHIEMPSEYHYYQRLEDCWKNDLFCDKVKPFDQDFETTATGGKKYIPESERLPLIQVPIGKQIVETVVSYTFGEDNFPRIMTKTDDLLFGPDYDIETTNLMLQSLLNNIVKKSFLRSAMLKAARHTVAQGRCIFVAKIVNGRIRTEIINMKWVRDIEMTPEDDEVLASFKEVRLCQMMKPDGVMAWFWCCRQFTQYAEIVYVPVEADGSEPKFLHISADSPEPHNLGFCPAIILCNTDDTSIFENQIENIKQYSYFMSHIVTGFKKNMNPQRVWLGDNPDAIQNTIRSSDTLWLLPPGEFKSDAPNPQAYQYAMSQEERLREIILRGCRVVEIPNSNYQSGDALKMKLAPELNLINETREELGDKALVKILEMLLAIVVAKSAPIETDEEIIEPSLDIGYGQIPPLSTNCDISLGWGEIFMSTAQSRNLDVQTAVMAANPESGDTPLMSQYSVRQAISTHFNVNDLAHEQMQIQKEQTRRLGVQLVNAVVEVAKTTNNLPILLGMLDAVENTEDNGVDMLVEYLRKTVPDAKEVMVAITEESTEGAEPTSEDESTEKEGVTDDFST